MKKTTLKEIQRLSCGRSLNKIIKSICGEQIGTGLYRNVYILKQDNNYVVKIERDMSTGTFANATEWRNYINNKEWKIFSQWLATIELINETGQLVIQERIYWDNKKRKDYPTHIPSLFSDTKLKNFGWAKDGRFVCCDYSFLLSKEKYQLRYAKWWGKIK